MRKITSLLMMLLSFVGIANAQTAIETSAFDASKLYRVYNCATDKGDTENMAWTANGSTLCLTAYDGEQLNQLWQFIEGETAGKYLLYNPASKVYMQAVGGNNGVSSTTDVNAAVYYTMVKHEAEKKFAFYHGDNANTATNYLWNDGAGNLFGWKQNSNELFYLEDASETLVNQLSALITEAQTVYDNLTTKTFAEAVALGSALSLAKELVENVSATPEDYLAQIPSLSNAKTNAAMYPFVESVLKTIEPGNYFIYYTDAEGVKHYLQTESANTLKTVTENAKSYQISAGANGKYSKSYHLAMNNLWISNTGHHTTEIKTEPASGTNQLEWRSQVIFELNGKAAIRLTNAATVDGWHGHYFINKNEENAVLAADPSLAEDLFIWTIEADLQGMRDDMSTLKAEATTLKTQLEAFSVQTTPLTEAIDALSTAIAYAEDNATSNDIDVLNLGLTQLNAANTKANEVTFNSGVLTSIQGKYVIYYEDESNVKHYLVNNKATGRVVTSTTPAVYDIKPGNVNGGYAAYAHFLEMNESRMSNPTNTAEKEIQVMKPGQNYERVWESPVLYMNATGKYAIRTTNCVAGSGWNSDHFMTINAEGTSVYAAEATEGDALYKWNIVEAEASVIEFDMTIDSYKSLYLNYAVTVPAGLTAYAVSVVNGDWATLTSVGNVIPKNTPVILSGEAGKYTFANSEDVDAYAGDNKLVGSWYNEYIQPAEGKTAYVLANGTQGVGLYKAALNKGANGADGSTHFLNNANKVYLLIDAEVEATTLKFNFGGTTAIESVVNGLDVNAPIYDLSGRRVNAATKGIYIQNGKKFIVK